MVRAILGLGLVLTAFFAIPGLDQRAFRLDIAMTAALSLILVSLFRYGIKPIKNYFILALIALLPISAHFSFPLSINVGNIIFNNSYLLKSCIYFSIFTLMIFSVYSIPFTQKTLDFIASIVIWCGFIMALYALLQWLGIDQFYVLTTKYPGWRMNVGGTLASPSTLSAYLSIIAPLAAYRKKYFVLAVILLAIIATQSRAALAATIICLSVFYGAGSVRRLIVSLFLVVVLSFSLALSSKAVQKIENTFRGDGGRYGAWTKAIKDVSCGAKIITDKSSVDVTKHGITGFGPGAFTYLNNVINKNSFVELHNEYLETYYNLGILGVFFLLCAIGWLFVHNLKFIFDPMRRGLLCAFLSSCLTSIFFFTWHFGAMAFLTSFIVGLLHKEALYDEKYC